jgi:DNA mismatch repair protein MutL
VEDLFYNVPARRKFLKAETTELRHIVDVATRHALGHETVHYVLRHNNRTVLDLQGVPDRLERIAALLGKGVADDFVALFGETATISVEGFVSRPTYYRKSPDQVFFILNGRWIQNRSLMAALLSGYEKCLPPRHYPAAVLYLTVNPHDVDVNVHPSKIEVKFVDEGRIFSLVRSAVQAALSDRPQSTNMECAGSPALSKAQPTPQMSKKTATGSQTTFLSRPPATQSPDYRERVKEKVAEFLGTSRSRKEFSAPPPKPAGEKGPLEKTPPESVPPKTEPASRLPSNLKVLGQVLETYILCRSPEGIIIVDMHAAHERIRYENLLAEASRSKPTSEHLLFPARVELSPTDVHSLLEHRDILAGIGFEIEDFGGGSLSVSRLPIAIDLGAVEPILRDLAVDLREYGGTASWEDLLEKMLIRISCHSALRSGKTLRPDEMEALIDQLRSTPRADTCPHGRPTWVRLRKDDLERIFKRSGF